MLTCVLMWLGRGVAARAICLIFQRSQIKHTVLTLLAAILDLSVTTTPILPFGTCCVIMHKTVKIVHRSVKSQIFSFSF